MINKIFKTLEDFDLTSSKSAILFSKSTRDIKNLNVWKDKLSGVIYIKDHYVGDKQYQNSEYLKWDPRPSPLVSLEEENNFLRRFNDMKQFFFAKKVCDFGCGSGRILQAIKNTSYAAVGIEMQKKHKQSLKNLGIQCFDKFQPEHVDFFDIVCLFHVLEHLPDPMKILCEIYSHLKTGGKIIVEVPHARELLLSDYAFCEEYKKFTLWSQHLILHTRHSLSLFLKKAGFKVDLVKGVQRYPLSNHLHWLVKGKPGGHETELSVMESTVFNYEYESALNKIDATDTILAIATKT